MRLALFKMHLAVFLAGFTGIFGKLIDMNEGLITWYRLLLTWLILGAVLLFRGELRSVPWREFLKIGGLGAILALHWAFFYASIKYSNVSICVVCFSTTGFFTAVLDPVFSRRRVSALEILFSFITIFVIALIFPFDSRYRAGVVLGVASAVLMALFLIFNKKVGRAHSSSTMLFYEVVGGSVLVTALLPFYLSFFPAPLAPGAFDLFNLLLLSGVCTVCLYLLQIQALQEVSPFTVGVSYNLEPVYSIILAAILFGEMREVNVFFFIGLALVCVSVLLRTLRLMRSRPPEALTE